MITPDEIAASGSAKKVAYAEIYYFTKLMIDVTADFAARSHSDRSISYSFNSRNRQKPDLSILLCCSGAPGPALEPAEVCIPWSGWSG